MFHRHKMAAAVGTAFIMGALMASPVLADDQTAVSQEADSAEELVTADVQTYANIRSAASMNGSIIGSFKRGDVGEVISVSGSWTQIKTEDVSGYVYSSLLMSTDETTEETAEGDTTSLRYQASDEEISLLAAIIQCEAGGESYEGKVAVGAVVLNRVDSSDFPSTISDVIYQSGQFTPAYTGTLSSVLSSGAREDCYEAARAALAGENPVGTCLYFHSGSGRGLTIGNQTFY